VDWREFTEEYNGSFTIHLPCLAPITAFSFAFSLEATWGRVGTHLQVEVTRDGDLVSWAQVGREFPVALGPDGKHLWVVGDHLVEQAKPGDLVTLFTGRGIVRRSLCLCLDHSE